MLLKAKKSQLYIGIPLLVLLFQHGIINNTSGIINTIVGYADEFVVLYFLIVIGIFLVRGGHFNRTEKNMTRKACLLLIVGGISTIIYHIQPLVPSIIDAFVCVKFLIVLVGTSIVLRKRTRPLYLMDFNSMIRVVVVLLFILLMINMFVIEVFPPMGDRSLLFFESQKLFFSHSAELAEMAFFCLVILFFNDRYKNNFLYMIMASILVISAIRIKEIAIVLLLWLMYFYFIKMRFKSKAVLFIVGIVIVLLFGYDQFLLYYGNHETGRALLTSVSLVIANERFPFGAGFATFASSMSNSYYSPLYYKYNLNNVWGLGGGGNYNYISDTFWPIVFGEFGWIGVIIVVLIFAELLKKCLGMKKNQYCFVGSIVVVGFLIVVSLGASSIFNPFSVLCAALLSYFSYSMEVEKTDGN